MNILLTNDDGIYAEGIYALYQELSKIAKVTVVAPDGEQSSVGHGITLSHPIRTLDVQRKSKPFGIGVSGTPADCVKFALNKVLKTKPDMVISGINLGMNDGCSVHYSGTVAGAREGALMGIPAIAISLATFVNPDFHFAAKCGRKLAKAFSTCAIPRGTFLNVNVPQAPASKIKGVQFTRQGMVPIHGTFRKRIDPNSKDYYWMTGAYPNIKKDDHSDTYALQKNYVTVTPIQSDHTNYPFLEDISNLKLSL